ncbi:MAG: hypothetical protein K6U80_16290 [Firmicutes bacterium]|nr:hypothetical protein [Bacillota bacterium]
MHHMYGNNDVKRLRHQKFWTREQENPLLLISLPQQFPLLQFTALCRLLSGCTELKAADLDPSLYIQDYERQWQEALVVPGSGYWAARPLPGVPWVEGMLGCTIRSTGNDLWAQWPNGEFSLDFIPTFVGNPWQDKYLEFIRVLQIQAGGRYPVAQSILRGPSDVAGAILGGTKLIMACYDRPILMRSLFEAVAEAFLALVRAQWSLVSPFEGGYVMNGFGLWCPNQCIVFQEDLATILSPSLYRKLLLEIDYKLAEAFPYSGIHLHQSSLFLLDEILQLEPLNLVQITCENVSTGLEEVIKAGQKVLQSKHLLLSGFFSRQQIDKLINSLPLQGLALQIFISSIQETEDLLDLS